MIPTLIEGVIGGFLAHQSRTLTESLPHGYRELVSYAIGVIATYRTAVQVYHLLQGNGWQRFARAYFGGFLIVGSGVVVGWVADTVSDHLND